MDEIKIGYILKRRLKEQRKTLKEVSSDTGIPYSTLHTWYENRQPKDLLKAQALADYLEITLHQLLFDKPDARENSKSRIEQAKEDFFKGTFEIIVRRIE